MSKSINPNPTINYDTLSEITGQPELWNKLFSSFLSIRQDLRNYLQKIFNSKDFQIILTGAGTSAFIGDVLSGMFNKKLNNTSHAVATTDLVTHPELYFKKNNKYLVISFARSGGSPESAQVILLSESLSGEVSHLIITCSDESTLIDTVNSSSKKNFIWLMPPEANDKGLAMTGSFTTMLLAGLLLCGLYDEQDFSVQINLLSRYGQKILNEYSSEIRRIAEMDFNRAVFLGSGMLKGIARESHLKLQELTDGKVICKYDSFLGFRHGPKAVINERTLVTYLFSNEKYSNNYEVDLVQAISSGRKNLCSIAVMENDLVLPDMDLKIILSDNNGKLNEGFLSVAAILPAQLLGFYKSLDIGLNPDSPSDSGMIHRVVQGVKIYPYYKDGNT